MTLTMTASALANGSMTIGDLIESHHDAAAHKGRQDGLAGVYAPPVHYGTQMSAGIRRSYFDAYLANCGDPTRLTQLDRVHAGVA